MRAFLDACVLFPPVVRSVLLAVAARGAFTPLWSARVLEEWALAARRRHGPVAEELVRGESARLAVVWPDAAQPAHDMTLTLPDPDDVHVAAAAIGAGADTLITFNLRDFPLRKLRDHSLTPRHPDNVLWEVAANEAHWPAIRDAVRDVTADAPLRATLKRAGLPRLGKLIS